MADEYKARATYRLILGKFGPIRPFVNIVESEKRHAALVLLVTHDPARAASILTAV
ncbi:hypothetical protein [Leptodesmis sp.]|uniref:hypothetical protein n=1 Tax=Leptodesmis sp. TaxID=3100501 RepID=UPI004053498E